MKTVRVLLAIVLLAASLSACAGGSNSSQAGNSGSTSAASAEASGSSADGGGQEVAPKGVFPVVSEPVALRVWSNLPAEIVEHNIDENYGAKFLEEKLGIDLVWEVVGVNDAKEKLRVIMAANSDMPDVFMLANTGAIVTSDQIFSYGQQGLIIPLNDYIAEYGEGIYDAYEVDPQKEKLITATDGNIYGLPWTIEAYHHRANNKFYINKAWLDKLELAMPETIDDFYNVLVAFRDGDPNGNGIKDEVPLSGSTAAMVTRSTLDCFLMNAFQYSTSWERHWLYLNDQDEVAFGATTEGWRDGLRFFRKLYDEGLMDKEIFVNTNDSLKALSGAPDGNMLGSFIGMFPTAGATPDNPEFLDYVPLAPLEGPAGRFAPDTRSITAGANFAFLISSQCENPAVAYRLGDYMMHIATSDQETYQYMDVRFGEEGVNWERPQPGDVGLDGEPALLRRIIVDPEYSTYTGGLYQVGPFTWPSYERNGVAVEDPNAYDIERVLYEDTLNVYEPYRVDHSVPVMNFTTEDTEAVTDIRVNVLNYGQEALAMFVTGEWDIETDWDKYVQTMEKYGVDTLVEITNKTYQDWKTE